MPMTGVGHSIMTRAGLVSLAFALAVAALLLSLAVPRTIAAFQEMPGNSVMGRVAAGKEADDDALALLAESRRNADAWVTSGRVLDEIAHVDFLRAARSGEAGGLDEAGLRRALSGIDASLAVAPANPHGWVRRAYAALLLNHPPEEVASALTMSMLTARYEPDLMYARLAVSLESWNYFSADDRLLVLDQVRMAWRRKPARLVELAASAGRIGVVYTALAGDITALADLDRRLAAQRRKAN